MGGAARIFFGLMLLAGSAAGSAIAANPTSEWHR
jgi:hypothetical protein